MRASYVCLSEVVGRYEPSYKPPNMYELREILLKKQDEKIKEVIKKQEEKWDRNGCSILLMLGRIEKE